MANYKILKLDSWPRKNTFEFFNKFEFPFYNMTATVEVTRLKKFAESHKLSFSLASLYCAGRAANEIENFRYRIREGEVICFDTVHVGSTILYDDNTFGFCYFDYHQSIFDFCKDGSQRIANQLLTKSFDPRDEALDLLHCSVIPWVSFSSFQNARRLSSTDSVPKIVLGKFAEQGQQLFMPVSVEVHHALVDGYHVGLYFKYLQEVMDGLK